MTVTETHPLSTDGTRLDSIQNFTSEYWWLGFLGFWEWVHPVFGLFYLCFLFIPVAIALEWLTDEGDPTEWIEDREPTGVRGHLGAGWATIHPVPLVQSIIHRCNMAVVRGRKLTPDPDEFDQEQPLWLPFDDEWTILSGSPDKTFAHDTGVPQHRYAYDFVITDDKGSTYDKAASGTDPATHYCYGEPVLAPADGTVVNATDSRNDSSRANGAPAPTYRSIYGNYVVIDHGDMVTVLAHLQQGSLTVQVGDTIEQGEQIASCGYSGNASEPQLHMHVQDRSRLSIGIGLPARFDATDTRHLDGDFMNDKQAIVHCGQGVKTRKPTDQS
ncbi:M23 family metallopeptidase [Natranaeroarchaeum aerophilus]|uniref:M23 family metallopeptidase n=1 Tax=Natranaeroarchaeum aerophilus TaxID=2917711 RepID=A0AAE3FUI1_9EURY|nr:M23 family metallopeptidase [Natranaeroarchaeum aerophilus]MCL9815193.1 M23 family metallopeptidase [Natranaeroarchaeum aerophilus]